MKEFLCLFIFIITIFVFALGVYFGSSMYKEIVKEQAAYISELKAYVVELKEYNSELKEEAEAYKKEIEVPE